MDDVIDLIKEKLRCIRLSDDYQVFPSLDTEQFEDGLVKAKDFLEGKENPKVIKVGLHKTTPDYTRLHQTTPD